MGTGLVCDATEAQASLGFVAFGVVGVVGVLGAINDGERTTPGWTDSFDSLAVSRIDCRNAGLTIS